MNIFHYKIFFPLEKFFFHGRSLLNKNKQFVMVAGGWDGREDLSSTKIYDTAEEKWKTAGNMKNGRCNACAVMFGQEIWVMGGYGRMVFLIEMK